MQITVIGEQFQDAWHLGDAHALSPEAPIPSVKVYNTKYIVGGAANVSANLHSLGVQVHEYYQPGNIPLKSRLLVGTTQVARWDERDYCQAINYTEALAAAIAGSEGVIISDYGKGAITAQLVHHLTRNYPRIPYFIDSKNSPERFATLPTAIFFPNGKEFAQHLHAYGIANRVVYKQGERGMCYLERGRTLREHRALLSQPRCVSGAGDTVIAAYTIAHLTGKSVRDCLEYASLAAAVVCAKPFTACATAGEIADLRASL